MYKKLVCLQTNISRCTKMEDNDLQLLDNEEIVSPLLDISFLHTIDTDIDNEEVDSELKEATSTDEVFSVLENVHKKQIRRALISRKSKDNAPKTQEQELDENEDEDIQEEQVENNDVQADTADNSFKPFTPIDFEDNKEELDTLEQPEEQPTATNEEDLFGDYLKQKEGFGGISIDMLNSENKMAAAEALSAKEFKENGGVLDPNNYKSGDYIDKDDYYTGKNASKENVKRKTYLTEEDGLFDPERADDSQVVLAEQKTEPENPEQPEQPVEENKSPFENPKYRVKKSKGRDDVITTGGRGVAWMAYILFFIPLIFARKKEYVRFHVNQGLMINLNDILAFALVAPKLFDIQIASMGEVLDLVKQILFFVGCLIEVILIVVRIIMMVASIIGSRHRLPLLGKKDIIRPYAK